MRPTKEAQDAYFRENGLDPWGYDQPYVRDRLDKSLAFIQRFVSPDFGGVFVEIGAFNGQFTKMLAKAFPLSSISASDLTKAAWEANEPFPLSIDFQWCDMADFQMPPQHRGKRSILIMMECLYYMSAEERAVAVDAVLLQAKPEQIFVSAPLEKLSRTEVSAIFGRIQNSVQLTGRIGGFKNTLKRALIGPHPNSQFLYRIDKLC